MFMEDLLFLFGEDREIAHNHSSAKDKQKKKMLNIFFNSPISAIYQGRDCVCQLEERQGHP